MYYLRKNFSLVFDIGPRNTCDSDFVELYDVDIENSVETFKTRYCGEVSGSVTCHVNQNFYCLHYSEHEMTSHSGPSCHTLVESCAGTHFQPYLHTLLLLKLVGETGIYF